MVGWVGREDKKELLKKRNRILTELRDCEETEICGGGEKGKENNKKRG